MAFLSKPGLIPVKIENQSNQITTQVNKINFTGSGVTSSVGQFNDVTVLINGSVSASYALNSSYALTSSYFSGSITNATSASYAATASYSQNLIISGSVNNVDYIDFNTASAVPAWKSGRVFWDDVDGALSVYNAEQDISLQIGQENWTRVYNNTGVTILNGTVVRLSGSHGDVPTIEKARSIAVSGSVNINNQILGLATHDIEDNSIGYITTQGLVHGLDTSLLTEGATIFVSQSAGILTTTAPSPPYELIPVGVCVKQSPGGSGIIYVAVQQPIDFSDLSSAEVGVYSYGDIWVYRPSGSFGVWNHSKQLSGSYGLTGSLNITGSLTASSTFISGNVTVLGTASINNLIINQIGYSSGSNQLGDAVDDTQTLYGTVTIPTGSLKVSGSTTITGSLIVTNGITGSFSGSGLISSSSFASTSSYPWFLTGSNIAYNGNNVGINETNPRSRLTVQGSAGGYWISMDRGNTTEGGSSPTWAVLNNADPANATYGWAWYDSSNDGSFSLWRRSASTTASLVVKFDRNNSNTYFAANVIITGSATNSLIVKGSGTTSATTGLRVENSSGTGLFVVRNDGYVGIGTTGPSDNLTVIGSTSLYGGQTSITGATSGSGISFLVRNLALTSSLLITNTNSSSFGGNVDITGNLTGNPTSNIRKFQAGYYYDIHPEADNPGILPFYSNDIAYNTLRGGQFTASFGSGSTYTLATSQIEAMFDGSPNYNVMNAIALSGSMTASIVFPQNYFYGNIVGFSFGSTSWRAKDFTVELLVTGSYYTIDTQTNYPYANYNKYIGLSGDALQGMRITFSNFASATSTSGFRIAQIFLLNYNGTLGKAVFMGRDGGSMYKSLLVTGSITSTSGFIGSLTGTSSFSTSASYASVASTAPLYTLVSATSSMLSPYLLVSNTSSFVNNNQTSSMLAPYLLISNTSSMLSFYVPNSQTGSFVKNTGSFATTGSNNFIGNQTITGSLRISGSISSSLGFTGSLSGTSSFAVSSSSTISSSYATNADYAASTPTVASTLFVQGYLTGNQNIPNGIDTIINFERQFDPNLWLNIGTRRFTPTVAGYYLVTFGAWLENPASPTDQFNIQIRKSTGGGPTSTVMILQQPLNNGTGITLNGSRIFYMDGALDYLDFTAYQGSGSPKNLLYGGTPDGAGTWFSAHLITM